MLGRSATSRLPTMAQLILWLLGAALAIALVLIAFAVLLRPFRIVLVAFIVLMTVWFLAIIVSGILDRIFGVGGWLLENSAAWAYLFWRCRAVIVGMLIVSLLYRWAEGWFERRAAA